MKLFRPVPHVVESSEAISSHTGDHRLSSERIWNSLCSCRPGSPSLSLSARAAWWFPIENKCLAKSRSMATSRACVFR